MECGLLRRESEESGHQKELEYEGQGNEEEELSRPKQEDGSSKSNQ